MSATHYMRNREAGYMAREVLQSGGYHVVRTARTDDPVPFNLIAWRAGEPPALIRTKRTRIHSHERTPARTCHDDLSALRGIALPYRATRHLWIWTDRQGWRFYDVFPGGICEVQGI